MRVRSLEMCSRVPPISEDSLSSLHDQGDSKTMPYVAIFEHKEARVPKMASSKTAISADYNFIFLCPIELVEGSISHLVTQ